MRRARGDEARFEALVRTHGRSVRAYAHSVASTPTVAEDATQETFLRAWRYLDSFRGSGPVEGWLIRICRNAVHDLESKERRSAPVAPSSIVRLDHLGAETTLGAAAATMEADFEVLEHIGRLALVHREILVLCGLLGYDYEAAATILDIPVGTVRSRLHRARSALDSQLAAEDSVA